MNKLIFNKSNLEEIIYLFDDKFYLEILDIRITKLDTIPIRDYIEKNGKINSTKLIMNINLRYEKTSSDSLSARGGEIILAPINDSFAIKIEGPIINEENEKEYPIVKLILENNNDIDVEIEVEYTDIKIGNITNSWEQFRVELNENNVSKILFSAPFGAGKTTFLKMFFEDDKNNKVFKVFHLFPVNYSVASNSDIFEYIKFDILYKLLLDETIQFDKEDFSKSLTAQFFLKDHFFEMITPFLKLIPKIGGATSSIFKRLLVLKEEFDQYYSSSKINDEEETKKFIEAIIRKEGSLYEDNFYTQLIRQLLEQIKQTGKKTVLIIDDLDRMDPEHIFRILNVFAAQFDSNYYQQNKYSDKFGFDKIIVVTDFNNLVKIFKHRYGKDTDYTGYLNKFYSKKIYFFDNIQAILSLLPELSVEFRDSKNDDRNNKLLREIIKDLTETENLNLREFIKLKKNTDLQELYRKFYENEFFEKNQEYINGIYDFFSIFLLFKQIFDWDTLSHKINECSKKVYEKTLINPINDSSENLYYQALQPLLAKTNSFDDTNSTVQYNGIDIKVIREHSNYGSLYILEGDKDKSFNKQEFYQVLNESFKVFESLL